MFQWAGLLETAPWAVGFTNMGKGGTNKREYIWVLGARLPGWEGGGIYKNILIPNFFSTSFSEAFIHLQTRQCLEHLGWVPGDEVMEEEPRREMKSGERGVRLRVV